jgi:Arc/MetJ-type ribon-helix-helix transcriptional regulator
MKINLPAEQQRWLEAQVAAGSFASIDEALAVAVGDLMAIQDDDLAWAKTHVDRARASVDRGDVLTGEEYFERLKGKIETLRSR